jgi:hypothetical protein
MSGFAAITGFNGNGSINITSLLSPFYGGGDISTGVQVESTPLTMPDSSVGFGMVLAILAWVVIITPFWVIISNNRSR